MCKCVCCVGQAPKLPEKARAPAGQVFTMAEVEKHDSAASAWFVHSNKVRFHCISAIAFDAEPLPHTFEGSIGIARSGYKGSA